jgi:hypothetical protein
LIATVQGERPHPFVILLPITHSPPRNDTVGIAIPAKVGRALGLDDAPSWVIVSEHNIDEWPNGLARIPGRTDRFSYGFIPPGLFAEVKSAFLEAYDKARGVRR